MTLRAIADTIVNHPRRIYAGAAVLIIAGLGLSGVFTGNLLGLGYATPGSESDRASDFIEDATGFTERDVLVVASDAYTYDDPEFRRAMAEATAALREADPEILIAPPGTRNGGDISEDGHAATAVLALKGSVADRQELFHEVQGEIDEAVGPEFEAGVTGNSPVLADLLHIEETDTIKAEAVGLPIAAVLLLLAFGSVVAAGLPLVMAICGLLGAIAVITGVMLVMDFNIFAETFMVMFGLALGIDYSLLFVRRFREERATGDDMVDVVERTLKTAGRTIMFSGAIFSAALFPVVLTGLPFFSDTVLAVIIVVGVEVLLAVTLLPTLLAKLGDRLDSGRVARWLDRRRGDREEGERWARWANRVMDRPLPVLVLGTGLLLAAAVPLLNIKTGIDLNTRALEGEQSVKPITELSEHFPNSAISPVEVLVRAEPGELRASTGSAAATMERLDLADVQTVPIAPGAVLLSGTPQVEIDSNAAFDQIHDLRDALGADLPAGEALVTGVTAETVDYSDETEDVTPFVIAAALLLSFVLLTWLFRSPVLAAKAIVMNLLSICAALGLTVLLFQEGLGEGVFDFSSPGYLQTWTPLTMFVLLFGLSMDYEVFMVSRIREEYDRVGDTREAVALGLQKTGSVVTYAAAIMIAIFASFLLSRVPEMKQMGFGLAIAVLLDATLVRAMLVPAFMKLAGKWNWWIPERLDRMLPEFKH